MTPALRRLLLTTHVVVSVGWLGAVAGVLVLGIAGLTSGDAGTVRGAYVSMNLVGQVLLVPLSIAALLTGVVQSLASPWGLFRHYWVVAKFVLTIGATFLLLLHQYTAVAEAARRASLVAADAMPDVGALGARLVGDAALAIVVLLVNTVLSIYKPWGTIADRPALGVKIAAAVAGLLVAAIVALHLAGVSPVHHGMH